MFKCKDYPIWKRFDELERAIIYAAEAHIGQQRKNERYGFKIPYIMHPMDVMKRVWLWGAGHQDVLVAAVLHDVVEDTTFEIEGKWGIQESFGPRVASIVEELTFREEFGWTTEEKREKKKEYVASFATKSVPALVIKLADRLCNTEDWMVPNPEYASRYFHKADALFEAVRQREEAISDEFGNIAFGRMWSDYEQLLLGTDQIKI